MGNASSDLVLSEVHGATQVLTLNRPEKRNAVTRPLVDQLVSYVKAANADPQIGAIVITGAGSAFCSGADVSAVFAAQTETAGRDRQGMFTAHNWVHLVRTSKPMIAAINGVAAGVGITLALPMDIIMGTPQTRIGFRFTKMGLVPELASSHFLPARIGFGRASEMMLTGRFYDGEEAHGLGLLDRLVDPDALLPAAIALGNEIADNFDGPLKTVKSLLTENAAEPDFETAQEREMSALRAAYDSPEHKEAVTAFMEKRAPVFR